MWAKVAPLVLHDVKSLRKARQTGRSLGTHGREDEICSTGARATAVVFTGGRNARALRYAAVVPKENANADRQKANTRKKRRNIEYSTNAVTRLMPTRKEREAHT